MFPDERNEDVERISGQKVAQSPDHRLGQVGQVVAAVRHQVSKNLTKKNLTGMQYDGNIK